MLSQRGGHAKVVRRLIRTVITPTTVHKVHKGNISNRQQQRLCGSEDEQIQSGKTLGTILSKTEVKSMLHSPTL